MKKTNLKTFTGAKSFPAVITILLTATALFPSLANAHGDLMHDHGDNPVLTKVMFDQLELRERDGEQSTFLDAQAWIGKDLNKLWLKVDAEKYRGEIQDAEIQALYSRAIAPYWDLQLGVRQDIKPEPKTNWGVIGFQGLAPYFFEVDAALFIGESGRTAARFSAEYELLFTQRLILSPEIEVNVYGQNDSERMTGSGLSDLNVGLRLRYEIYREFAPYIGINWEKKFGSTADFVEASGEDSSDTEWVLGLRAWF
jgi:copper resistance protein B